MKRTIAYISFFIILAFSVVIADRLSRNKDIQSVDLQFDGDRAFEHIKYQVSLGPRIPESQAHAKFVQWIEAELSKAGWNTTQQVFTSLDHPIINIIGRRDVENGSDVPWIILGAHYDSRLIADRDPNSELRSHAVPGANDGASGVAVLLELARVLPKDLPINVWLVFFDGEDNGNIPGWDWILGSRGFVERLEGKPDAAIIVDMIGDSDLNIYYEKNSDPELSKEIWGIADNLAYSGQFIPIENHRILDDHIPFLEAGIKAVDIIDFNYPYWHTTMDTMDKVSPVSLKTVGETLRQWLIQGASGVEVSTP